MTEMHAHVRHRAFMSNIKLIQHLRPIEWIPCFSKLCDIRLMEPNSFPTMHALSAPKELRIHLQHAGNHIPAEGGLEGALIVDDVAVATLQRKKREEE